MDAFDDLLMMDWPTTFSELVKVGISALVESKADRERLPPRPPYRWRSAGSPTGVKSNLKSPVQTIFP